MNSKLTVRDIDPDGDVEETLDGFPVYLADGQSFLVDSELCDSDGDVRDDVYREHCHSCGSSFLMSPQAGYPDCCPLCGERLSEPTA